MTESHTVYTWKHESVDKLINVRIENDRCFGGKRGTAKQQWTKIAEQLACGVTGDQCKKKWQNLIARYKTIMNPPTGDGLEEEGHDADEWPYFDAINRYMSDRHVMNPQLLLSSSSSASSCTITSQTQKRAASNFVADRGACVAHRNSSDEDDMEVVVREKKHRPQSTCAKETSDLLKIIMEQMEETRRQQEEARNNDRVMMEMLKKFLSKK